MSTITPTNSADHKDAVVTTVVKDTALVAGGLTWYAMMLIVGLVALAIGILAVPVMFFTAAGVTGEVINEAAELTGQEPHTSVMTDSHSSSEVTPEDPNNVSDADQTSHYRGSAETPKAFPSVHGTD